MSGELFTELVGYVAIVLLFLSFQFDNRRRILSLLILTVVFLSAHQVLLGAFAGASANGLTIVRNLIFYQKESQAWAQHWWWPYVFSGVLVIISIYFWEAWYSLLPALAVIASTFALWLHKTAHIRLLSLLGPLLWIPYALVIDSTPTLLIQLVLITSILIAMFRFDRPKKPSLT